MSKFLELKAVVEQAWENRAMLNEESVREVIRAVVEAVDKGELRTAEP
ncbi:MAG: 2,3,4,5-tetrahydropyridine-2,6-dicarboxylate N-succinyltransferase, partial [Alistipes sp.]|nr:2,3,4,5-tetrahydropyridine-2,6-dicarboxylate N-succinyltransferase [Alistipes sp.]